MIPFALGQRWINTAVPELGTGIIIEIEHKTVLVQFPFSDKTMTFSKISAPLKRAIFSIGDEVHLLDDRKVVIAAVLENGDQTLSYQFAAESVHEGQISFAINIDHPEEKIFNGMCDSSSYFSMRMETLKNHSIYNASPVKGHFGGRIDLFAHQQYVVDKICKDFIPRSLLADEVGLGKTIEAGMTIHRLIIRNMVERVLIILPEALVVQWYLELARKYNLLFTIINQNTYIEENSFPFLDNQFVITTFNFLKGSSMAQSMLEDSNWDMLVVDEAHHLQVQGPENTFNFEMGLVAKLASKTAGLLLLTATPEEKGERQLFALLQLIDSKRYASFDEYLIERKEYLKISSKVQQLLHSDTVQTEDEMSVDQLIDCYGTGKAYIRNFRAKLEKHFSFFPKRILFETALDANAKNQIDTKSQWLVNLLKDKSGQKFLLICHAKEMVVTLEKYLLQNIADIKIGVFHSGQSLTERDRQAAYFADDNGAQILLCTEIGSEGRNFEFCSNLVLFDLPKLPGLLEQRIGRLDRIGQKNDVAIFVPYFKHSAEEIYFNLFHHGLNAFTSFSSAGTQVYAFFHTEIITLAESKDYTQALPKLIEKIKQYNLKLLKELEEGRDFLLELNSFNEERGFELTKTIRDFEEKMSLKSYLDKICDVFQIEIEDLNESAYFLSPHTNMIIPHFPGLPESGMSITFDRKYALLREDISFMNWDHPMIRGAMGLILSEKIGTVSIVTRKNAKGKKSFIEVYFAWNWVQTKMADLDRFFPSQLIRVLLDFDGIDFSEKWSREFLDEKVIEATGEIKQKVYKVPKEKIKKLISIAREQAILKLTEIMSQNLKAALDYFMQELTRIDVLEQMSGNSFDFEKMNMAQILNTIDNVDFTAGLRSDSIRVIV